MSSQLTYAVAWPYQSNRHHSFIHLMVQSPTTLFAYWEISERRKQFIAEHYRTAWHMLTKQVRLVYVSQLPDHVHTTPYWDVAIGESESWYFRHVQPNTSYRIDYGILNACNQFIALCCSHVTTSPRNEDTLHHNPCTFTPEEDRYSVISFEHVSGTSSTSHDNSPFPQFSTYSLYTSVDLADSKDLIERT